MQYYNYYNYFYNVYVFITFHKYIYIFKYIKHTNIYNKMLDVYIHLHIHSRTLNIILREKNSLKCYNIRLSDNTPLFCNTGLNYTSQ